MMRDLFSRMRRTANMMALAILIIATFTYAMFQGGFVSWFLFYAFIPFWAYPILLSFYPIKSIEVARRFNRHEYSGGDLIEVEIKIKRKRFKPIPFLIARDCLSGAFENQTGGTHQRMISLFWKKEIVFQYTIPMAVRGEHVFSGIQIEMVDLLGFYEKKQIISCKDTLLVYPDYKEVDINKLDAFYEQGEAAASVRTKGDHSVVSGVRSYTPGDRMSWIHWKATARRNEVMTKEFEERKSQDVLVILDATLTEGFERTVSYAASFVHSMLLKGVGVAFMTLDRQSFMPYPARGEQQRRKIMYELAKIVPAEDDVRNADGFAATIHMPGMAVTGRLSASLIQHMGNMRGTATAVIYVVAEASEDQRKLAGQAQAKGIVCYFVGSGWTAEGKVIHV
ncbi:DUF58 domain-containing protein [Bacillus sp. 1P06AnD]|uniref:DUF58 domain-containing protein n=1 Tax=Bacillus sp. 1P06AnD TaxID=3132208 RepID=UPI0039A24182